MRIVLLVADSVRADAPGFSGGACATPTLDRLAREGAHFSNALSCAPWTVPSFASMLTGRWSHRLGLYRWEQPLPRDAPNLFLGMADAGCRVASFVFEPDHLFSAMPEAGVVGSSQDLDAVISWLEQCTDRNLFLVVHYWGTHFPYLDRPMTVPQWYGLSEQVLQAMREDPALVIPKVRELYQRSIERMSELFLPRLAAAVTRHSEEDGHLLVVTADHGETWGDRRVLKSVFDLHGNELREESLRVPLVFWGPRWLAGRRVEGLARSVDLAPTLLELVGGAAELPMDGGSLLPSLRSGAPTPGGQAFAAASADFVDAKTSPSGPDELWTQFALREGAIKYVWDLKSGARAWFDLNEDPQEAIPRAPGSGEPSEGWASLEQERAEARCEPLPNPTEGRLRSLGYLG